VLDGVGENCFRIRAEDFDSDILFEGAFDRTEEAGAHFAVFDSDSECECSGEFVAEAQVEVAVFDGGVAPEFEVPLITVGIDAVLRPFDDLKAGEQAGIENYGGDEVGGTTDGGGQFAVDDGGGLAVALSPRGGASEAP
jgi:hypothetical protein